MNHEKLTHEELMAKSNAILDDLLETGGTTAAIDLATQRLNNLGFSEEELLDHILSELNPTPEQVAQFLSDLGIEPELALDTCLEAARRHFSANVELLRGAALDIYPDIPAHELDLVLSKLHSRLSQFKETSENEFLAWALPIVRADAEAVRRTWLLQRFDAMREESRLFVYHAVWKVLRGATDLGIDAETFPSIESKVWSWLWFDQKSPLHSVGTAKATTRIYAYARLQALGWKQDRLRQRKRYIAHDEFLKREHALRTASIPKSAKRRLAEYIPLRPEEDLPLAA